MEKSNGIRWMAYDRMCFPKKLGGMGFRRISEFNIALLGKQIWRILTTPRSFIARLLKARYFPQSSILNAGVGNNPTYVWRSILAAKNLIVTGSILKVGSGRSINIWGDPWIPEFGSTKVSTATVQGLEGAKVDSLLRMNSKEWDFDLVRDIFNENDARRILKIPLPYSNQEDKWMWIEDSKGEYTVKSGYRVLSRGFSQNPGGISGFKWLRLWNLAVPPKMKNFMWRVMHDCLPTLENLRRKCVDVLSTCQVCKLSVESLDHSLLACPFANRCWNLCNLDMSRLLGICTLV